MTEVSLRGAAWIAAAVLALLLTSGTARALELNGYLQESIAVRTDQKDIIFHRQLLHIEAEKRSTGLLSLRLEADVWRDDADFQAQSEGRKRLREAYAKLRFPDFDLRLGRIQIAWGEADGIIISDQIAPFDLTNFIVPQFDEIRLGVDGATLDYYFESGSEVQLVWISHFQAPEFPELASPWSFVDSKTLEQQGLKLTRSKKPAGTFRNSEFGVRYSGHPLAADWSLGYFRSWDDRPSLRIRPPLAVPTFRQFDLFTFNIVHPAAGVLLRMDSAYERGRYLPTDPTNPEAAETAAVGFVSKADLWRTLVAVDFKPDLAWWEEPDASLQFIHETVFGGHRATFFPDKTDYIAARFTAAYRNETIKPWLFTIVNVRGSDAWAQAKVDYLPIDNWRFTLEYDVFLGHRYNGRSGGIYGSFAANDMLLTTIRFSF